MTCIYFAINSLYALFGNHFLKAISCVKPWFTVNLESSFSCFQIILFCFVFFPHSSKIQNYKLGALLVYLNVFTPEILQCVCGQEELTTKLSCSVYVGTVWFSIYPNIQKVWFWPVSLMYVFECVYSLNPVIRCQE